MGSADLSTGLRFVLRMGLRDATWMLYGHCTYVGPVRHKMGRFFRPTGLGRTKREDHTWDWMIVSVRRAIEEKAWPQESAQFLRSLSPTSPERQPVDGRISSREPKERGRGSEEGRRRESAAAAGGLWQPFKVSPGGLWLVAFLCSTEALTIWFWAPTSSEEKECAAASFVLVVVALSLISLRSIADVEELYSEGHAGLLIFFLCPLSPFLG